MQGSYSALKGCPGVTRGAQPCNIRMLWDLWQGHAFSGKSVTGRRTAFTWQGRTPAANLAAFCTSVVPITLLMCSQSLEENLFEFPILSDVCNAPVRNYNANITRQLSCLEPSIFLTCEFCFLLGNMLLSHLVSYQAETLLWEERGFFLLRYLLLGILPWARCWINIFGGSNRPAHCRSVLVIVASCSESHSSLSVGCLHHW